MEKIRSRKFARFTAVAAVALTTLAGCGGSDSGGGGGFDVDAFADQMSEGGAMTKDQAKCIGEYIDKNGSDEVKSELQKAVKEGDDAEGPDDPAVAEEVASLILAASPECITG